MRWSLPIPGPRCSARIGLRSTGNGAFAMTMPASSRFRLTSSRGRWRSRCPSRPNPRQAASPIAAFIRCAGTSGTLSVYPLPGRVILRFGAVDYAARVWVNGCLAVTHEGGHTPFWADITSMLDPSGKQKVTVRVEDDPHELAKPRGKQDWQLEPHAIWYPRTTGIWQTVWFERVPDNYIEKIRWTPLVDTYAIGFEARVIGVLANELTLDISLAARRTAARA